MIYAENRSAVLQKVSYHRAVAFRRRMVKNGISALGFAVTTLVLISVGLTVVDTNTSMAPLLSLPTVQMDASTDSPPIEPQHKGESSSDIGWVFPMPTSSGRQAIAEGDSGSSAAIPLRTEQSEVQVVPHDAAKAESMTQDPYGALSDMLNGPIGIAVSLFFLLGGLMSGIVNQSFFSVIFGVTMAVSISNAGKIIAVLFGAQ